MKFKKLNQVNDGECWHGGVNWNYVLMSTNYRAIIIIRGPPS